MGTYSHSGIELYIHTGPLEKLFHYAIFQKFFHIFLYINGVCFTIHLI